MSFVKLKVDELVKVAEFFAVDVEPSNPEKGPTKKELLAALAAGDEPVTWAQYEEIYVPTAKKYGEIEVDEVELSEPTPVPVVEDTRPKILLKMERENGMYEIRGYTFTRQHPFRPVVEEDAEWILSHLEGFRMAMPREVDEYYK